MDELQTTLDKIKADFEKAAPESALAIIKRATQELVDSEASMNALREGSELPPFSLSDSAGNRVESASLFEKGPLILSFFRGFWCPYCVAELDALQRAMPTIRETGGDLIVISPQLPAHSASMQEEHEFDFPILFDEGLAYSDQLGLTHGFPDDLTEVYKKFGIDVAEVNGTGEWTLPMPARYLIDANGLIRNSAISPDYTKRPDPKETLELLWFMT